jgi:hypothetical protein
MFGEEDYEREIKELATSLELGRLPRISPDFALMWRNLCKVLMCWSMPRPQENPFGKLSQKGWQPCKPVVATAGGAVPEIVQDGVTGLLVPMGDAQSMAEAITKLLSDPELAGQMGEAGRQRVEEHFTMEHVVQKVEFIYDEFWERRVKKRGVRVRP